MPTYVYRCHDCENVFEEFQRITADPGATCPGCGERDCTRQITGGTFHLKGSGWYASDYNKPQSKPTSDAETEKRGSDESATESKANAAGAESTETAKDTAKTEQKSTASSTSSQTAA